MQKKADVYRSLIFLKKPICVICDESIEQEIIEYEQWKREAIARSLGAQIPFTKKRKDIDLTIDHLLPRSKGGTHDLSNLALVHRECNHNKGNLTLEEYKEGRLPTNARRCAQKTVKPPLKTHLWSTKKYFPAAEKKKKKKVVQLEEVTDGDYTHYLRKIGLL